jgi:hypothetical protein
MHFRRAEIDDLADIKQLIKGAFGRDDMERALKRRYGEGYNMTQLMYKNTNRSDTNPLSLVCVDDADNISAFISLTTSPQESLPPIKIEDPNGILPTKSVKLYQTDWTNWITQNYMVTNIRVFLY